MTLFLVCGALLLYLHHWQITFREHYIVIGILAGLMACTRFSAVIPLAVFYFSDFVKAGLRRQIIGLLAAILTFVIIFLPFVFWESEQLFFFEYNPFVLQTRQGHLSDLLILVPCFLFLSYREQKDIAPCFLKIAWCLVILVIVTFVHNMLLDGSWNQLFESQYDITYFNMALPFLIGAMNKGLDIRNSFWGAGNQNRSTLRLSVLLLLASCSLSLKSYSQSFKETGQQKWLP